MSDRTARMARTTILDAALQVLDGETTPRSAKEIHDRIVKRALFSFKAQDTVGVVRAAIRRHLSQKGARKPEARLREVERDRYLRV